MITAVLTTEKLANQPDSIYELFTTEELIDKNGLIVEIPKSLGKFTLAELNNKLNSVNILVNDLTSKISAINLLN